MDTEGRVFLLCGDEPPMQTQITTMLTQRVERLSSRFRVTFAMILQLRRFARGGVKVEDVMGSSFLENGRALQRPALRRDLARCCEELERLPPIDCVLGEPSIEEYAALEEEARACGSQLHEQLYQPQLRGKAFCVGRCLRVWKTGEFASSFGVLLGLADAAERALDVAVLSPGDLVNTAGSRNNGASQLTLSDLCVQIQAGWVVKRTVVCLDHVVQLFDHCLALGVCSLCLESAAGGRPADGLAAVGQEMLRLALAGIEQPLVLSKVMNSRHVDIGQHDVLQQQQRLQHGQAASKCHTCPMREAHLEESSSRRALAAEIEDLGRQLGAESLGLLPQLQAREQVLRLLGCLDSDGLITLKGRVATEVLCSDEVTIVEVLVHGVLEGATPAELASAVSAFVFPDKADEKTENMPLPKSLARIREAMLSHHRRIEGFLRERCVDVDPEEYAKSCNVAFMGIAYRWACGEPLAEIMKDTWLQEGTIVRAIVRAEELLRKLQDVARLLGKLPLREACMEAAHLIRRDIAFTPSLYLE